ncbi:hypothetical protein SAMD00019534_007700 [Acytostelium subglobosum LB1]|uniref:hypothetical protein n=1 Tax=Acytostelium subglobosum LB1 TaxID=1410327 RepID=UPI000644BBCB|nr:hypothetical protein SAMD00019534_007700 [Acytostelium subglobosum LB1]GAM17595.1 hypothetical protein SAMD00019534_007700 [Acytostelium subglobosum LB1]|eukprot:XP_012759657.1 hypothetical protein SAMD00019534_007700 [Acytostelium subglobosum LB1]
MGVDALKDMLSSRSKSTSGNKNALVDRLFKLNITHQVYHENEHLVRVIEWLKREYPLPKEKHLQYRNASTNNQLYHESFHDSTLSGTTDIVIVPSHAPTTGFLAYEVLCFVELKTPDVSIQDHLPQALVECLVITFKSNQSVLGLLTNGTNVWILVWSSRRPPFFVGYCILNNERNAHRAISLRLSSPDNVNIAQLLIDNNVIARPSRLSLPSKFDFREDPDHERDGQDDDQHEPKQTKRLRKTTSTGSGHSDIADLSGLPITKAELEYLAWQKLTRVIEQIRVVQ